MNTKLILSLIAVLLFLAIADISAQSNDSLAFSIPDSNAVQILEMYDGVKLRGQIVSLAADSIVFRSSLGDLKLAKVDIKAFRTIERIRSGKGDLWFKNPNTTRLFFAPTGRMLAEGSGYFSDYYVFFPGFAYGMSDHFTIGGGVSLIPGVGIDEQLFYFTPKMGIVQSRDFNVSTGVLLIRVPDEETAGIAYGVATWGGVDKNFTLGAGYGFVEGDLADKPMLVLGVEQRGSEHISAVSENWFIPGSDIFIFSGGLRFFGENLSVDLAFWTFTGEDSGTLIPYVDFVYNFK